MNPHTKKQKEAFAQSVLLRLRDKGFQAIRPLSANDFQVQAQGNVVTLIVKDGASGKSFSLTKATESYFSKWEASRWLKVF